MTRKCPACGCWAVFEIGIFCKRATERCTHCGYAMGNLAWDREARQKFEEDQALLARMCERYPQLRNVQRPGDHLKIDDE